MINIKADYDGKGTEIKCEMDIKGRNAAVCEFYGVITALSQVNNEVLTDALGMLVDDKFKEMRERSKNDESES